jgi:hypothetical protein
MMHAWAGSAGKPKRTIAAHRLSFCMHYGDLPARAVVRHRCDNEGCVNPKHLILGTQLDNMADRAERGRTAALRGERNPRAKLTTSQVREIRQKYVPYTKSATELAKRFGVSRRVIAFVVGGRKRHYADVV